MVLAIYLGKYFKTIVSFQGAIYFPDYRRSQYSRSSKDFLSSLQHTVKADLSNQKYSDER